MQKDDVVEVLSGKVIAVQPWRLSRAIDNGSVSRTGFFGYACGVSYFGRVDAEVSGYLFDRRRAAILLNQVEEKALS